MSRQIISEWVGLNAGAGTIVPMHFWLGWAFSAGTGADSMTIWFPDVATGQQLIGPITKDQAPFVQFFFPIAVPAPGTLEFVLTGTSDGVALISN